MVKAEEHEQAWSIICFGILRRRLTSRQLKWLLGYVERCRKKGKP